MTRRRFIAFAMIRKRARLKYAAGRATASTNSWPSMPECELARHITEFINELRRENSSPHTVRNYESDLEQSSPTSALPARRRRSLPLSTR